MNQSNNYNKNNYKKNAKTLSATVSWKEWRSFAAAFAGALFISKSFDDANRQNIVSIVLVHFIIDCSLYFHPLYI
jgi:hypothetical protein